MGNEEGKGVSQKGLTTTGRLKTNNFLNFKLSTQLKK
jgi:hypothetical protein